MNKEHVSSPCHLVDYWLSQWLNPKGKRKSEHTKRAYTADIRAFLSHCQKPYDDVLITDLMNYQSSLSDAPEKTGARKMASVRSFYRFLNNQEAINPPLNLAKLESISVKQEVDDKKVLTEEEVKALLEALGADPVGQLFARLLYLTGARRSEALGLTWRDLKPEKDGDGGYIRVLGKGSKPRRVAIPCELWADLLSSKGEAIPTGKVFPSLNQTKAWDLIVRAGRAAGIERQVTPHMLRHSCASHLLEREGVTVAQVRDMLGHKNISTTSLYVHSIEGKGINNKLGVK